MISVCVSTVFSRLFNLIIVYPSEATKTNKIMEIIYVG